MNCTRCGGTGQETDHVQVGSAMRALRKEKGLTLAEVALRTGWSTAFISDLERGRRSWNGTHLDRIGKALQA